MNHGSGLATALILAGGLFSCATEDPAKPEPAELTETKDEAQAEIAIERAEAATRALGKELMQRLSAEMKAGGPVQAVQVCSEVAQQMAEARSVDGLTVRRISLKVRNPADTPDAFEREKLIELQSLHDAGELPTHLAEVVTAADGEQLRYLRPIRIASLCLPCHGQARALDPEVAEVLGERYPEDQATGYADGDLRGAFSVTVRLP